MNLKINILNQYFLHFEDSLESLVKMTVYKNVLYKNILSKYLNFYHFAKPNMIDFSF